MIPDPRPRVFVDTNMTISPKTTARVSEIPNAERKHHDDYL